MRSRVREENALMVPQTQPNLSACGTDSRSEQGIRHNRQRLFNPTTSVQSMRIVLTAAVVAAAIHAAAWYLTDRTATPADVGNSHRLRFLQPVPAGRRPADAPADHSGRADRAGSCAPSPVSRRASAPTRSSTASIRCRRSPASLGLNVALGAWVGDTPERDKAEIEEVVQLAKQHRNVRSVLVGNEVLLRAERTPDEMIALIQKAKKQVRVPVSTGEIWYEWMKNPKLVSAVDFLAVHILPYWEGIAPEQAVSYTLEKIDLLRKTYPGKRIVVAEFGWPSQGYNRLDAVPGPLTAGGDHPRLRRRSRAARHRVQHRRGLRSDLEDQRRKRRRLLGPVRRRPQRQVPADRPGRDARRRLEGGGGSRHRPAAEHAGLALPPTDAGPRARVRRLRQRARLRYRRGAGLSVRDTT